MRDTVRYEDAKSSSSISWGGQIWWGESCVGVERRKCSRDSVPMQLFKCPLEKGSAAVLPEEWKLNDGYRGKSDKSCGRGSTCISQGFSVAKLCMLILQQIKFVGSELHFRCLAEPMLQLMLKYVHQMPNLYSTIVAESKEAIEASR